MTRTCSRPSCWRPATVAVTTQGLYLPRTQYICTYCAGIDKPKPLVDFSVGETSATDPVDWSALSVANSRKVDAAGGRATAATTRLLRYIVEGGRIGEGVTRLEAAKALGMTRRQIESTLGNLRGSGWLDGERVTAAGIDVYRRRGGGL